MRTILLIILLSFSGGILKAQNYSYDQQLGEKSAKQVEMMMGLYPDSVVNDYVDRIGSRLTNALGPSPFEFKFFVVDMAEPNAFALPGGYIYVSRGLLSLVNEEDELVGVMGHEMIHVTKRHSVKQMKKSILPSILMLPGALVGGLVNEDLGNVINAPISLGSELFLMNYSRRQEKEADLFGVELASEAGYNPTKLAIILNHLSEEVENLTGEAEQKSYFSSHPFTPKRVDDLNKHAQSLSWKVVAPIASDKQSLFEILRGMYVGSNPEQGIFDENKFLHPELNLSIQFPEKWKTVNVPVAVGAFEEDGNAQIILTLEDKFSSADSAANTFALKYEKMTEKKPLKNEPVLINGLKARHVSIREKNDETTVLLHSWWIHKDSLLLNVIGASLPHFEKEILDVLNSLNNLSETEKIKITGLKLNFAEANTGESIADFCQRTSNAWSVDETAIMNGIDKSKALQKGQLLKIAIETPYF